MRFGVNIGSNLRKTAVELAGAGRVGKARSDAVDPETSTLRFRQERRKFS